MRPVGDPEQERLDLWLDDALEPQEAAILVSALERSPSLRQEAERMRELHLLFKESRVPVRPGFAEETLRLLEPAPWQVRIVSAWWRPLAALLVLAVAAFLLVSSGSQPSEAGLRTVLSAWLGLVLSASEAALEVSRRSWEGFAFGLREWWSGDPWAASLAIVALLAVQVVLWRRALRRVGLR